MATTTQSRSRTRGRTMRPQKNRKISPPHSTTAGACPGAAEGAAAGRRRRRRATRPIGRATTRRQLVAYKREVEARRKTAVAALGDLARGGGRRCAVGHHLLTGGSN